MTDFRPLNAPPPGHDGEHRYVHVIGSTVFIDDRPGEDDWRIHFIGMVDGHAWWAVDVPADTDPSYGAAIDLRRFYGRAPEHQWLAAGRAVQIVEWARTHRFCGRCGAETALAEGERAMRCPGCDLLSFPRLSPAMITLVTRGEPGPEQEALLARGVQWDIPMYSCLAGFVEPGESLESAVVREVHEEVGITVSAPSYFGSQPWPFPNSLMIGFRARYESGEIECDPAEIADAGWFLPGELPMVPPGISIARRLIDAWLAESVDQVK
ncbi:MAG: NAD(+) diphosphatase [Ilumatobacter sp.]|uniref:NAD(+) diphosphatase n=1 Tax=Ilumatobacter sp. TaxID=1967498 RepID=UPI00260DEE6A|nr:NAD(+) diphosphatase [Ilumatobacter sp.]MDJ0768414.1 NAD(+) diphosphatase [Ilumatobacter sp.]